MRAIDDEHGGAYRHRNFTGDDQDGGDQKRMRVVEEDILSPDQLLQLKKSIENCKNVSETQFILLTIIHIVAYCQTSKPNLKEVGKKQSAYYIW